MENGMDVFEPIQIGQELGLVHIVGDLQSIQIQMLFSIGEIIDNQDKLAKSYQFSIDQAKNKSTREVLLGITGSDWPNPDKKALAWRITLIDGQENELAVHESFLWAFSEN